jgi:hypothetical protein
VSKFKLRLLILIVSATLLLSISSLAQQPQYLGFIPSDTINSLFGGSIVPLGDQDGDGFADILVMDLRYEGRLYRGGQSVDPIPQLKLSGLTYVYGYLGDLNDDGYVDVSSMTRIDEACRIRVYLGGPGIDSLPDFRFGVDSLADGHTFSVVGDDINGNGSKEIITANGLRSAVFYELSAPWDSLPDLTFSPPPLHAPVSDFGARIALGDFNGDGDDDVAFCWRPVEGTVTSAVLLYWGGSVFDTLPDLVIRRPNNITSYQYYFGYGVLTCPGDLNDDGWDDLVIGGGNAFDDTLTFVYFGGPALDTVPDLVISEPITKARPAGDINGDGHPDLLTGTRSGSAGYVSVYYGGSDFDSLHDARVWYNELPGTPLDFPMDIAGIGDYNGDGIDDFAASGLFIQGGRVYIIAGFQDPTDVPLEFEDVLPNTIELHQNYPNPFNPSTTIEFALSEASQSKLEIVNVLGQRIKTLVDRQLAAGSYRIKWDGKDGSLNTVASGVYFCNLKAGGQILTTKMLFIR